MKHLTPDELVAYLDDTLSTVRASHVDTCDSCLAQVNDLQSVLAQVESAAEVPEPSPLFWDHFSARVRAAVDGEPLPVRAPWWQLKWPAFVAVGAVLACVLVVAVVARRDGAPVTDVTVAADVAPPVGMTDAVLTDADNGSVAVVAAMADGLSWEDATTVNLTPTRSAVDAAVAQLTEAQRREFVRLVRQQMGGAE